MGGWDAATTNGASLDTEPAKESVQADTAKSAPSAAATASTKKTGGWAGLFAKPPPAPKPVTAPVPAAQAEETPSTTATAPAVEESVQSGLLPPPIEEQVEEDAPFELPSAPHSDGPNDLPPGKDELTEINLDQLPDESHPPTSQTAASTTASTQDPLAQQVASAKAPIRPASGYAATALKATTSGGRSASFMRKVKEQQEAVVMPGNHAVEKAAVQFGKMGLNGEGDDLDDDREEPETRTQLLDDSPVAPRASLPPALPESQPAPAAAPAQAEIQPPTEPQAQRQAPGLPPAPQQVPQAAPQVAPGFGDPYRYGPPKPYDPFGLPPTTQAPASTQEPFAAQVPGQPQAAAQNDMASYYSREAYQQYYGYGQQHDAQRSGSAFGTSAQETPSQYATARPQQAYGQQEATNSGNNTPAPGMPAQHSQASQQQQQQQMTGGHGTYPYGYPNSYGQQYPQYNQSYMNQMSGRYGSNRPMFDDARRQQQEDYYSNQYAYGSNQHYGGGSYKSGMYGQPHQQYSHDYASSPANAGSFGGREGSYARSGSTQPSDQQAPASGHAFGGMPDPFGRSSSGFGQAQAQALGQQHGGHQASEDAVKPSGPSPSIQAGRPGSTVNTSQAQQSGLGQPQTHNSQQAFGSYPQYGGSFGNFGGQQGAHQSGSYGTYGNNAFGTYGGYGGGRGWNH